MSTFQSNIDDEGIPSRVVLGYQLGRTLGKGMSGKVKLGTRLSDGKTFALKFINTENMTPRSWEMLDREIKAMEKLNHPNILNLVQHDMRVQYPRLRNKGFVEMPMLVLELSEGGELFEFLMETGYLEEEVARTYFKQLLACLELCHSKGVYHRDLKPENLLLAGDSYTLKLADFGLAALQGASGGDQSSLVATECGTKSYMAPEVMKRAPYDGSAADVWSAGVVLFIMLAGNPPFEQAAGRDWWYRACKAGRHDKFWQAHLRNAPHFPYVKWRMHN